MEANKLFGLAYLPLEVTLAAQESAELPDFLGSTLRGVLGQSLYENQPVYRYLFTNGQTEAAKQYDTAQPYIIEPPFGHNTYTCGQELRFRLLLLGTAMRYAPEVIAALRCIGSRGLGVGRHKFKLTKVCHAVDQRIIWADESLSKLAMRPVELPNIVLAQVQQADITLLTTLRIRRGGKLLQQIDFATLIRNIVKRIQTLTERYGGSLDCAEAAKVQQLAANVKLVKDELYVQELSRYSNRLGQKMDFGGLLGSLRFQGELTPFVPWLEAARLLHIGRNTTFGMGQIKIEYK